MISIPCLRFTVCNFKIQSPNDLYNKKNLRLFIFFRKDFNMVPRGFLVSFEGSRYSYQLTLMFWLNNGPISNIFRRKCKIKARSCQLFFFTSNSLLHFFFSGIAWSRSSDSFEVNGCILVTLIFLSLTYFVKTIDIFTLVGRSFEHSFFISFDTINMWNIYKIF